MTITDVPAWTPGDFLRKAREQSGMTQRQLAAVLGLDHSTVVDAEKSRRRVRPERVHAWARATGVEYSWLQWNVDACGQADMRFDLVPVPAGVTSYEEWCAIRDSNPEPAGLKPRLLVIAGAKRQHTTTTTLQVAA